MSAVTTTNNILVGEDWVDVGVSSNYEYNDKDWLTKITSNGNGSLEYNFEYDAFGRTTCIKVGNQPLIITEYDGYGRPTIQTYGNHNKLEKSYDPLDRVTEIKYNNDANKSLWQDRGRYCVSVLKSRNPLKMNNTGDGSMC